MRLANPVLWSRRTHPAPPAFEPRRCPIHHDRVPPDCEVCEGTGFVRAPAGMFAVIVARAIMRGAVP